MNCTIKLLVALHVALVLVSTGGCAAMKHELQPHRLWRMNRTRPMGNDAYFSVADSVTNGIREQGGVDDDRSLVKPTVSFSPTESPKASANPVARIDDRPTSE